MISRGTGRLDPETRERIRRIAREMGYRPNLLVQGIQTGRTQTVGVMVPPGSAFFGQILGGIQDELVTADCAPIALATGKGATELDQIVNEMRNVRFGKGHGRQSPFGRLIFFASRKRAS